jgi:hypothetical protein
MILLVISWIISLGFKNFQQVFTYKRSLLAWALLPVMHLTSKGTYLLHVKPFAKVCSLNRRHLKPTMQCACTQHNNFVRWVLKFVQWVLTQGGQVLNPNTIKFGKLMAKEFLCSPHYFSTLLWKNPHLAVAVALPTMGFSGKMTDTCWFCGYFQIQKGVPPTRIVRNLLE